VQKRVGRRAGLGGPCRTAAVAEDGAGAPRPLGPSSPSRSARRAAGQAAPSPSRADTYRPPPPMGGFGRATCQAETTSPQATAAAE